MSRMAYRLWTNKCEEDYIEKGYTRAQATLIINFLYDVDEDYTSKKEYLKSAKSYAKQLEKETGLKVNLETLFGLPIDIGYRYCSRCQQYYWDGDYCGCEE